MKWSGRRTQNSCIMTPNSVGKNAISHHHPLHVNYKTQHHSTSRRSPISNALFSNINIYVFFSMLLLFCSFLFHNDCGWRKKWIFSFIFGACVLMCASDILMLPCTSTPFSILTFYMHTRWRRYTLIHWATPISHTPYDALKTRNDCLLSCHIPRYSLQCSLLTASRHTTVRSHVKIHLTIWRHFAA